MRINSISVNNIGSYEGLSKFDTLTDGEKNIILIGGKNGAGKTTLFTAIRVCLYGHKSMGFKNFGAAYVRSVKKMINDRAKLSKPTNAHVEIELSIAGKQSEDIYILKRNWILDDNLSETFEVSKNGVVLNEAEVVDFEKYLTGLIPTELFDLYFFDGESIADYFLTEGSNKRIKEAFLTLCGYDTFEIMQRNFKRVASAKKSNKKTLETYLAEKEKYEALKAESDSVSSEISLLQRKIDTIDAELGGLEKKYTFSGGISSTEWEAKKVQLKEEEKKRETLNAFVKKSANDIIPFVMIKDSLVALREQISTENADRKYRAFCEVIEDADVTKYLAEMGDSTVSELERIVMRKFGSAGERILDLSFEQSSELFAKLSELISYDEKEIIKAKRQIRKSIKKGAEIREFLDTHSVADEKSYSAARSELFEQKTSALQEMMLLEKRLADISQELNARTVSFNKAKAALEDDIKQSSINDISAKAILMLDNLQNVLYRKQIEKIENTFMDIIGDLMRKEHIVDDIEIDDDFNIHIFKNEVISADKLCKDLSENDYPSLCALYGKKAVEVIIRRARGKDYADLPAFFSEKAEAITVPMEKEKQNLSKGEKQILIMAIYFALISLCNYEVPFIIDTPFARIDTEHRENISKYFFSKLHGQVFILSTNEEINSNHVNVLKNRIGRTFLLENNDDINTTVIDNTYFGD